ncbi:HU family DNA-binding protein [Carboxylicivirga linearis]|uniref:HU family DNA-binding protein n=1 Tax=Carboxylicivirga linearis TaxID=1628157 RepID=UPI003742CF74
MFQSQVLNSNANQQLNPLWGSFIIRLYSTGSTRGYSYSLSSINLQSLGIFSLHFSSDSKDSPDKVNGSCIKNLKVQFRPSTKLKRKLLSPKFEESKDESNY